MSYAVKEIFLTLQGEGAHAGRAAVFCRFAGCNLWSGREQDRATATCRFCDTDFVGTDVAALGPPLENLSRFIWEKVQHAGPITRVSVHRDSCNESCSYFGPRD